MDLFELSATLGLDTSGFSTGITGAMSMITGLTDFAQEKFSWLAGAAFDFGKDVIETGIGFDKAMSAVQAVLGKEEGTARNMEDLRALALEQARQSVFTAEDMADAYYYMGMAGWKSEQMQKGLPAIWQLAAASGEDLARVSDIVTDSITAFGLTADDAQNYVDILAQTATNSNTDVKRMGETFKYIAPIAGTLGYSVEDTALSIGLLASAGIKGSQAGTTLRNIFTRIATNAGATSKDLGALQIVSDKLGVSFYDTEGKARDWSDVLTEMRASWRGMDVDARKNLIDTYNGVIDSGADADLTLKEFAEDAVRANDLLKSAQKTKSDEKYKEYANEIGEIGHQYDELLKMLGIPIPTKMEDYADALDQARIKLGMMSDEEKIYYAKQVGSMRGMSGFIRLLEATDEDLTKLVKSYENAAGAADAMSKTRLDNLGGDIDYLNAALDVLKIAIFDDIKGPLREVVQWASDAINDITDAINENGLTGGIEVLGDKIEEAGEKFRPMLESIGKAAAPVLTTVLQETLPALDDTIVSLGHSLGSGLFTGLSDSVKDNSMLSGLFNLAGHWFGTDTRNGVGSLTSGDMNPLKVPEVHAETISFGEVELTEQQLRDALDNVTHSWLWGDQVELAGKQVNAEVAQDLLDQLTKAAAEAGEQGGADMTANITDQVNASAPGIGDILSFFVGDGGAVAGAVFSTLFGNELNSESWSISDTLANTLGSAGNGAGWDIASGIQNALNLSRFTVGITGVISNVINKVRNVFGFNASAMSSGRIYTKPTVFGYYDNAYQVAGDAGPEAVVGVNSLQRMIQSAVNSAGAGQEVVVPRNQSRDLTIILELDRQQMGKMVYKLNNEETQRVGVRLANGGAY